MGHVLSAGDDHVVGDVRDLKAVRAAMSQAKPEVVIHMAAQSQSRT